MEKLKALYEARNKVWEEQKAINDNAVEEERDLTAEETEKWEKADVDFQRLTDEINELEERMTKESERKEKVEEREKFLEKSKQEPIKPTPGNPEGRDKEPAVTEYRNTPEYKKIFRRFLEFGDAAIPHNFEERAGLLAGKDTKGGFLVTPEQFIADLIKDLEDRVFVRQYARVISMPNATSLTAPELHNRIGDPRWDQELAVGLEDTTMAFAKRQLTPHPLARYIKVSKKLIRVATIDVEAEVRTGLAYEFATVEENAYLNGTGQGQPLGVMVAHAAGINTGRDVSTGNTTTSIKADGLIEALYTLKAQYRANCRWTFHRDALKQIRKLKDGEGNYLWNSGIATHRPATILDLPYDESEYMPNTFTSGLYVGLLGNWNYYWIVDALDMTMQVLTELFAMTNQNAYVGRKETDGAPVHENAFVRVKLAS